jgi:hypothetical protein
LAVFITAGTRYNARVMSSQRLLVALGAALAVAGCSSGAELEWMKVNQPYTAREFRRDYGECDKTGKLEECLRSRGWVSVTAPSVPKPPAPDIRRPSGR